MSRTNKTTIDWIEEYTTSRLQYEAFRSHLEVLLRELLDQARIHVQALESRTKTVGSFREKISRPGKEYADPLHELPDLVGLRVILYYTDDVRRVEDFLESEFKLHPEHSSDKRREMSPNEFGYLSVHHVVSLKAPRITLAEWKPYADMRAEVQIRTVLQHAWAAVSHALQYKHEAEVPSRIKRRLFRLAGLFELADEQFLEIRNEHSVLEEEIADKIEKHEPDVPLNTISLRQYLDTSTYIHKVLAYAGQLRYDFSPVDDGLPLNDYSSNVIQDCKSHGIKTLGQLNTILESYGDSYKQFLKAIETASGAWHVSDTFVLYLILIHIYRNKYSIKRLVESDWSGTIAERVLKGAEKAQLSISRRRGKPHGGVGVTS